ncbi:MAG: DUF882 domain-containing protein [Myxococcales bacterium]|nr:MAG: DUF882 domain-containing protein [Myxococcales bacterium]
MSEPQMLSPHFARSEMQCHCGCNKCIVCVDLLDALEDLRERVGWPLVVNSAYRCPEHNAAVGGKPKSKHLEGIAADVCCRNLSVDDLARAAETIPAFRRGGIGKYPKKGFVHVDVRRNGPARWVG